MLLERRAFDCRLAPDRSLGTLAEAEAFLRGWWGEPPGPPFAPGD